MGCITKSIKRRFYIGKRYCPNPWEKRGKQESTKKLKKLKKVLDGVENL